jgi:hypothetical protein
LIIRNKDLTLQKTDNIMDKTQEKKREEILKRLESTRERKRKRLAEMEEYLRKAYKEEYGVEPKYVGAL